MSDIQTPMAAAFHAIRFERKYQNERWGPLYNDADWAVADWVILIERYLQQVKDGIGQPEESPHHPLHAIRKIAALAVACMEYKGTRSRQQEEVAKLVLENGE